MTIASHAVPAVPVAMTGWSWSTTFLAMLNVLGIGAALTAWINSRPKSREIELHGEERMRADLMASNEALSQRLLIVENRLEAERARHNAETAIHRHRLNNVTQCLEALLMLLEQDPTKAREAVTRIREMRAAQAQSEAIEKAAIEAAAVAEANSRIPTEERIAPKLSRIFSRGKE